MNKEYTYIDGKVIVEDTEGNKKQVEYSDKLDEILVQENLIENMEDRILELEEASQYYKKNNEKHYIPIMLLIGILITTIIPPAISYWNGNTDIYTTTVNTIFGAMNEALLHVLIFSIVLVPFISLFELMNYNQYKNLLKKEKGVNSELEFLKQQIIVEKKKLDNLKKEKNILNEEKGFKVVEVDDLKLLNVLRTNQNLYFDLGYNGEKYYRYYQKYGRLPKEVQEHYTKYGQEIIEDYLEENKTKIAKTRIKKKK